MPVFEFSIIATGLDPADEAFEARFFEHGADDATISFQRGVIILDFAREAASMELALCSALDAVTDAGARILRIEPDPLVTLSDIAERSGLTRAAVSLFASGQRGSGFPLPVARVTSESPLWLWVDVAQWLVTTGRVPDIISANAVAIDHATRRIEAGGLHAMSESKDNKNMELQL